MWIDSPCLDSLFNNFEECCKRRESLQRAEKEAWQRCEEETKALKRKADRLDNTLQEEITRLRTLRREALSAIEENAAARLRKIQCKVSVVMAQADLDIAKMRMEQPGRPWSEELLAARYHTLNGDALKDARSRYLDGYEGTIREHEASLMAEDMELVALYLSWRTERVTSTRSCKLDLDEDWTQRINLSRLRAEPVRAAYETSKRSCRDDLYDGYATAASELSNGLEACLQKGAELETEVQNLVGAIAHQRDKKLAKLEAQIIEIEEVRCWQAEQLRDDCKSQVSILKKSAQLSVQLLLSAIEKRQEVFAREQEVISKDLRAVQATLTLMTSAIQTLGQDLNSSFPNKHTLRPPSTQDRDYWSHGKKKFDPHQHTYEKFKEQRRADETRRQHEVDEDERRRDEERLKREREEWLRREEAEVRARAERGARERFEREQARRRLEEEARRKREDEERRRAEEERRAREEEESRQRAEEEARRQAEEEKQRSEDARRREQEESTRRRREEERSRREEEDQQNRHGQQYNNNGGEGDAQSTNGDDDIDDHDDCAGGTRESSTAKGRTKFVLKCWKKYTEGWARLMAPDVPRLPFQEIPWPVLPPGKRLFTKMSITAILSHINKESIRTFILDPEHLQSISPKARIRKELLRFHPDKRILWLKNVKDEEKEQVDKACEQVALHLTDLLDTAA